ncbi:hypothetical protein [Aeromonas veronii]|uniref:hypothetical protein n=1 Tax=Aeromonas veronii TaxID=654 RepID=UPI001F0B2E13|nr:hypothetical protein [Aeromonas veronii]
MQITPLSADNRCLPVKIPFHDTDNVVASGAEVQITPLSADNRRQSAASVPFHDTDNAVASGH